MPHRHPTKDEKIKHWEQLAFRLNFHRTVSKDRTAIDAILADIDVWVDSHNDPLNTMTKDQVEQNVHTAFWDRIAHEIPSPPPRRGRPPKRRDANGQIIREEGDSDDDSE